MLHGYLLGLKLVLNGELKLIVVHTVWSLAMWVHSLNHAAFGAVHGHRQQSIFVVQTQTSSLYKRRTV